MVEQKAQEKGIVGAKEAPLAPKQFGKQDGLVEGSAAANRGGIVRATINGEDKMFVVRTLIQLLDEEKPNGVLVVVDDSPGSLKHYSDFAEKMGLPRCSEPLNPEESNELERLSFELELWKVRYDIVPKLPPDLQLPDEMYRTECEIRRIGRAIAELEEKKEKKKNELMGGMLKEAIARECQLAGIRNMVVFTQKELCSLVGKAGEALFRLLKQTRVDTVLQLPGCLCCFADRDTSTAEAYGQAVKNAGMDRVFMFVTEKEAVPESAFSHVQDGINNLKDTDTVFKAEFEKNPYPEKMFFVL